MVNQDLHTVLFTTGSLMFNSIPDIVNTQCLFNEWEVEGRRRWRGGGGEGRGMKTGMGIRMNSIPKYPFMAPETNVLIYL